MPRPRKLLLACALWLLIHSIIWTLVANFEPSRHPFNMPSMFMYWDSFHYSAITLHGYFTKVLWAFYPLYPLCVRGFSLATGLSERPEIAGLIFSTLAFAAFCIMQARLAASPDALCGLKPQTIWGWLFFLFSPASWVFHSHHTEALFLLLSFGALLASRKGRWKTAALLAGLCALTKNQGAVLAIAVAIDGAWQRQSTRQRILIFMGSGLISFLLFICFPLYQYLATGDALAFVHAQASWGVVDSLYGFFGTLWLANPWQQGADWFTALHHLFFFLLTAAALGLLIRKKEVPIAFYIIVSLWMPLYLGHLQNAFRYGAVLFPALFFLGDSLKRLPRPVRWVLMAALVGLNLVCARKYALGEWAY